MAETMFARVPFLYAGRELERGELVELRSTPRDDQLRGLGYFLVFDPNEHKRTKCDMCPRAFASEAFLLVHKKKKGGCMAPSPDITVEETAMLAGVDPKKMKVED